MGLAKVKVRMCIHESAGKCSPLKQANAHDLMVGGRLQKFLVS